MMKPTIQKLVVTYDKVSYIFFHLNFTILLNIEEANLEQLLLKSSFKRYKQYIKHSGMLNYTVCKSNTAGHAELARRTQNFTV
jgi:hypothetical protein